MNKPIRIVLILVAVIAIVAAAGWVSRGRLVDLAGDEVIRKFQSASCEQLKAAKDEPSSLTRKAALMFLHSDKEVRVAFIDRIAAPVLNKMIECGMAP